MSRGASNGDAQKKQMGSQVDVQKSGAYGFRLAFGVYVGPYVFAVSTWVWGIVALERDYGGAEKLWGSLADPAWRWVFNLFLICIGGASSGYFGALAYMLTIARHLPRRAVNLICGLFLGWCVTISFWMPLTVAYVAQPSTGLYVALRAQGAITGIFAVTWFLATVFAVPPEARAAAGFWVRTAGFVGAAFFAFTSGIMDGIVYPPFFADCCPIPKVLGTNNQEL